jgi:hypothetical protein
MATPGPLGISWVQKYESHPNLPGYKYYYGDMYWGEVIYYGLEDLIGMESEIQLFFDRKKITKAHLILGPAGINESNCLIKYKKVKKILIQKYGNFNYIKEEKDPIIDELLTAYPCYPISLGLHNIETHWNNKDYQIKLSIVSDDDGFYIEITYIHKNRDKIREKNKKRKIIKKF